MKRLGCLLVGFVVLLGLWLSFWLARALLHRQRATHPWYPNGRWGFTFAQWHAGASPLLIELSLGLGVCFLALVYVLITLLIRHIP